MYFYYPKKKVVFISIRGKCDRIDKKDYLLSNTTARHIYPNIIRFPDQCPSEDSYCPSYIPSDLYDLYEEQTYKSGNPNALLLRDYIPSGNPNALLLRDYIYELDYDAIRGRRKGITKNLWQPIKMSKYPSKYPLKYDFIPSDLYKSSVENHILEEIQDKINRITSHNNSCVLSHYPDDIYQLDYTVMSEIRRKDNKEILEIVWHPRRMSKWPEDPLIYDPDDNSMDYAFTNCTIRDIKMFIKLR